MKEELLKEEFIAAVFGKRKARQLRYAKYIEEAEVKMEDRCFALFAIEHATLSFEEIGAEAMHAAEEHGSLECATFALACIKFNQFMNQIDFSIRDRCAEFRENPQYHEFKQSSIADAEKYVAMLEAIVLKLENAKALANGLHR